ncbi:MAG: SDR family oxidoreductase [Streptosporangiaceae bacterium]|jgi:NAD(P)-dependent dehydrogenase (short-subunit alcohol dehydrogenase family)
MSAQLKGRTALVTGATSGIGQGVAQALAAAGAQLIVHGRDAARGADVVAGITSTGGAASFVAADLADGANVITPLAARAAELAGGPIDILVNNAAYLVGRTATTDTTEAMIDTALAVSVKAPILLTAALVPAMAGRGGGVIINMGSINGIAGMAKTALYSSTKSAVHGLTRALAAEYGPAGIRVNAIAPGPTLTDITQAHRGFLDPLIATLPSRGYSTPAQIGATAVFLASDDAANIHGAIISVDGGFTAI